MLLAYYGDDFTGSTDVLETLAAAGLDADLCVSPTAAAERLAGGSLPAAEAMGIAGLSRTFSPGEMEAALPAAFATLASASPRFLHYKVCSTFDSTPKTGSIGRAIEIGRRVLPARWTPVVVAAPHLGRWSAFGNLFARSGLDSPAYRLDRHPTMSRHPVTPMDEADLRLVLARQTDLPVSLIDLPTVEHGIDAAWDAITRFPDGIVLFDATTTSHLATIGAVLDRMQREMARPLFMAGSSGFETALTAAGVFGSATSGLPAEPLPPGPLFVISGSRSPVTQRQLEAALAAGFHDLLLSPKATDRDHAFLVAGATTAHAAGRSVILRPSDGDFTAIAGTDLGRLLGHVAGRILQSAAFRRVVVAGGDTSGEVARQLEITSLRYAAPLAPGAPWCRVASPSAAAGCVCSFKGGQVGRDDFLLSAAR